MSYLFGFNGMQKDDEVKGSGNSYDFGARIYDSRLGRFLSLDPLMHSTPYFSPYQYAANSPIAFVDEEGEMATLFIENYLAPALGQVQLENPNASESTIMLKAFKLAFKNLAIDAAEWTDVEDATILATWFNREGLGNKDQKAKTVSGADATKVDKSFAVVGALVPYLSGAALKVLGKKGVKGVVKLLFKAEKRTEIAQWIVDKGMSSKLGKELTGRWATKLTNDNTGLTAKMANYLDDKFGNIVQDVNKTIKGTDGRIKGDIDIQLNKVNIEVKSGGVKTQKVLDDAELAKSQGKSYILYAPNIQGTVENNLKKQGITIIKTPEALENKVKSLNK